MTITGESPELVFGQRMYAARSERHPTTCLFELTPTCNLRCQFCYVALDPYKGPYLSTAEVCRILDTLRDAGVLWLTLTGGEIFTRRDFPEIYRHARRAGFLVQLFTNATMMNEKLAALFREEPPFLVEVSIYGHTAELYEETTQIPGSFARFERGISMLRDCGMPVTLKTPMSSFTQEHLAGISEYARSHGFQFKIDLTIDSRHDGDPTPTLYRISPRKVLDIREELDVLNGKPARQRLESGASVDVPTQAPAPFAECGVEGPNVGPEELYRCGAGRVSLFIDALGNASHCVIDRSPTFPMLEMSWEDLWRQMGDWVTQPLPSDAPCSGCSLRSGCANCPARSRLATGSPYLKDPYYCDITHAIHGLEPAEHPDYRAVARRLGSCAA